MMLINLEVEDWWKLIKVNKFKTVIMKTVVVTDKCFLLRKFTFGK